MLCQVCKKEVVLVPSAQERAKKDRSGKTADYYTKLFPMHTDCQLAKLGRVVVK